MSIVINSLWRRQCRFTVHKDFGGGGGTKTVSFMYSQRKKSQTVRSGKRGEHRNDRSIAVVSYR